MSTALAWALRLAGLVAAVAAALRYLEWRIERHVIRGSAG